MKKICSLILSLILILSLSACGGKSQEPAVSPPEDPDAFFKKMTCDTLDVSKFNYDKNYSIWTLKYEETEDYNFDFKFNVEDVKYNLPNSIVNDFCKNGWKCDISDTKIVPNVSVQVSLLKDKSEIIVGAKAIDKNEDTLIKDCNIVSVYFKDIQNTDFKVSSINSKSKLKDFVECFGYPTYISPAEDGDYVTIKFEEKSNPYYVLSIEYSIAEDNLIGLQYCCSK